MVDINALDNRPLARQIADEQNGSAFQANAGLVRRNVARQRLIPTQPTDGVMRTAHVVDRLLATGV